MTSACVFEIEKFATKDGPGIRTTVFLKGCPLRCKWCHNPESWESRPQLLFNGEKCVRCGMCAATCMHGTHLVDAVRHDLDRAKCVACGACADACLAGALEICGREMTSGEVFAEVMKDKPFYDNSGGGITLSGGEPLAHRDFSVEILQMAKGAGLHTAVETCGFVRRETLEAVLPYVDLFLFDVKTTDPQKHLEFTGVPNRPILDNLQILAEATGAGHSITLRCPMIPGLNDSEAELRGIGELAERFPRITGIDVETYHPLGVGKARKLGLNIYEAAFPDDSFAADVVAKISESTSKPVRKA